MPGSTSTFRAELLPSFSRLIYQAAWADFDHDGDLGLVSAGKLFENHGAGGHWLEFRLDGGQGTINRSAIGAQVRIRLQGKVLTRQVEAGTGEGNQNDLAIHFGLGSEPGPVDLEVLWPNRMKQTLANAAVDRSVEIRLEKQS